MTPIKKTATTDNAELAKDLLATVTEQRLEYAELKKRSDPTLAKLSTEAVCGELTIRRDPQMVAMNKQLNDVRDFALSSSPVAKRADALEAELTSIMKKLETSIDEYCVAHGTTRNDAHDRLMANSRPYAEIYKSQFGKSTELLSARGDVQRAHIAGIRLADVAKRGTADVAVEKSATATRAEVALETWNGEVKKYAAAKGIADLADANVKFLGTPEGRVAKRKYDAALHSR